MCRKTILNVIRGTFFFFMMFFQLLKKVCWFLQSQNLSVGFDFPVHQLDSQGYSFILTAAYTVCWGGVCHAQLFSIYHHILVLNGHAVSKTAHTYLRFIMSSKNISWWEDQARHLLSVIADSGTMCCILDTWSCDSRDEHSVITPI